MKISMLFLIMVLTLNCSGYSQPANAAGSGLPPKVSVYFFHGTHRCTGCINAEKATVTVLNELYQDQQEKGIIKFQSVNIEEAQYKTLAAKYEIAWNTLLIVPSNNEIERVELTEQAFVYGTNPQGLKPYIKKAIDPMLK